MGSYSEQMLTSRSDARIFTRHWLPDAPPRGAVVIAHGIFEHSGRYLDIATHLMQQGYAVWAFDHYGHGQSDGPRGYIEYDNQYVDDLDQIVCLAMEELGDKPVLLGHSMGGTIAALYAVRRCERVRGVILSAPALRVYASPIKVWLGRLACKFAPQATMPSGLDNVPATHDPQWEDWKRNDPLKHNRLTLRVARFIVDAGAEARAKASALTVPVLVLLAGQDAYVDNRGAREFFERLPSAARELHEYPDFYHEVLKERGCEVVWQTMDEWLARVTQRDGGNMRPTAAQQG